jgi:SAM-dependent methyltransferase
MIYWTEGGERHSALWRSETAPPPRQVLVVDEAISADQAYGLACQGSVLLWRGDFRNARRMLIALARRTDRRRRAAKKSPGSAAEAFHLYRQARSQRARTLSALVVPLDDEHAIALPGAPDIRQACAEAYGPAGASSVAPLRALLGVIGAHQWRTRGIEIAAIGGRIHPHYGVFAPIRSEYVDLVAAAPLPASISSSSLAFDVGTGTGVLAAVLARRGFRRVIATDCDPRALICARQNVERLGLSQQVDVVDADLFPEGRAGLAVCNPPWLPGRPSSSIERAIYDPDSRMLRQYLGALSEHLEPDGEGWLILSDLAEHLGLRTRSELLDLVQGAGLKVVDRIDVRPRHPRAADKTDPLHAARSAEVTSLWRLAAD